MLYSIGLYFLSLRPALLQSGVSAFVPVVRKESPSIYSSFGSHGFHNKGRDQFFRIGAESTSSLSSSEKEELLETLRSMRVKELKAELEERKISTADAFEKDELVKRLYDARLSSPSPPKSTTKTSNTSTTVASKQNTDPNVIRGALSSDSSATVGSIGGTLNSESVVINDADIGLYPIMTIQIPNNGGSSLRLLLDTACSGVVLTPSAVQRNNLRPISAPVSTTGGGGQTDSSGYATMIERFSFGYNEKEVLGPLVAVVQDTGMLENLGFDGIIGLGLLNKYACTEIDLDRSEVAFYKTDYRPPFDESDLEVVAEGEMSPTRLGIWTVDTIFNVGGGKQGKPIKMLVDTGATTTILSWKGLQDGLGLSRRSPEVQSQDSMGGMGLGNQAMSYTHKIEVDSPIVFGRQRGQSTYDGLSLDQTASIDIGDVPIIDMQLAADNVAGILGMNILSQASMIRMVFTGPIPRITIFQKKNRKSSTESTSPTSSSEAMDQNTSSATTTTRKIENESSSPENTSTSPSIDQPKPKKKKKKRRY